MAILLHGLVALGLAVVPARTWQPERLITVEIEVAPPPPPSPPPPEPPPPPPERAPAPRKHVARPLPPPPAPVPNQESKPATPTDEPVQPVFGVTEDSVVTGDSPVAVPVGNTLMTKDRTIAKLSPPPLPPAPPPPPAFAPVDEDAVAEWPKEGAKVMPSYPEVARRLGLEGRVSLKLGIDRKGNVRSVRVLQKAGHGMDEEAVKAIWRQKFTPAKGANGQPVDIVIRYDIVFNHPSAS